MRTRILIGLAFIAVFAAALALPPGSPGSPFFNSYGKRVLERHSPAEMLYYTYVGMFVIMTPLVLASEPRSFARIPDFTRDAWIGLILLTFFHNYLSNVLFLKALKHLDAIQTAVCNYLITFFGVPIAAIWLGERLTPMAGIGGIIILGSTLLITVDEAGGSAESEGESEASVQPTDGLPAASLESAASEEDSEVVVQPEE